MKHLVHLGSSALLAVLLAAPLAMAQGHGSHGHDAATSQGHGGHVTKTKAHHIEVVFLREGVRIHVQDASKKPVDPAGVEGAVKVKFDEKGRKSKTAHFKHVAGKHGHPGYLQAAVDLTKVAEGEAKASFKLKGLAKEKAISFDQVFHLAQGAEFECPMKCVPASDKPGKCPKCGMNLARKAVSYACPMHAQVKEAKAGKCWICEMPLAKGDAKKAAKGGHGKHGGH